MLNNEQKNQLLQIAKQSVKAFVCEQKILDFDIKDERLNKEEGAFVTLHIDKKLRGCIGQIIAYNQPLWQTVRDMAITACSEDTRFMSVQEEELDRIDYEISVLSKPKLINDYKKIILGKHGVIIKKGHLSGVFLPQVAKETGWDRDRFLSELCTQKASLPADYYKDKNAIIEIFTAEIFSIKQ